MNELDVFEKLQKEKVELGKTPEAPFNILNVMYAEVYRKECTQSKIIAGLLDANKNHKFGYLLAETFFESTNVKFHSSQVESYKVETERPVGGRFIDIFISWKDLENKKHAIIIENKLYNAEDQINQLNDYHDYIEKEGYLIDKIVYMPLSEWKLSRNTDTRKDVLEKTIDFDAKKIVVWLEKCIKEVGKENDNISTLIQYKEFFECLILNKAMYMKAKEIQEKLSAEELLKIETLTQIAERLEWSEARFEFIANQLQKMYNEKPLVIKYKNGWNGERVCYAQFYFEPYKYWVELWIRDEINVYLCSYEKIENLSFLDKEYIYSELANGYHYYYAKSKNSFENNTEGIKFLINEIDNILNELAKYKRINYVLQKTIF